MKELSIEEKAKRYDEAIERAKNTIEVNQTIPDIVECVESLFPELKESEDESENEKIRKTLIHIVKGACDKYGIKYQGKEITEEKLIAWLEKQGKNDMGISEATKKKLEDNLNKALEKETPESWNKFLDEQDEQKPIDKIQIGKKYKCIASPRYSTFVKGLIYRPEDKFLCSLMNLCSDCFEPIEDTEQKSSWSEEDDIMVHDIDYALRCQITYPISKLQSMSNWIFNLKDRVHQQSKQNWSEEDEETLKILDRDLQEFYSRRKAQAGSPLFESQMQNVRWLKSLKERYTWKPSDEQIKALHDLNLTGNISYAGQGQELINLYNDLKKLKG